MGSDRPDEFLEYPKYLLKVTFGSTLKRQTVDGSIDRKWTRQEDINWTVQKYMLTVRTTESNSIQRLRSKVDDQKIQNHHW